MCHEIGQSLISIISMVNFPLTPSLTLEGNGEQCPGILQWGCYRNTREKDSIRWKAGKIWEEIVREHGSVFIGGYYNGYNMVNVEYSIGEMDNKTIIPQGPIFWETEGKKTVRFGGWLCI